MCFRKFSKTFEKNNFLKMKTLRAFISFAVCMCNFDSSSTSDSRLEAESVLVGSVLIHLCQLTSRDYARSPRSCSQKSLRCLELGRVAQPSRTLHHRIALQRGFAAASNPPAVQPKAAYILLH